MKKKLCALILAMACVCSLGTTGASAAGMDEQEGYSTTVISGEDAIQAYLEEVGEPYDPNLVEVIRVEYERNIENTPTPAFISREYERRNEKTRKYTDFTDTVAEYLRPAGRVSGSAWWPLRSRVYPCNFDGCRIQEVAAAAVRCGAESQDYKVRGG